MFDIRKNEKHSIENFGSSGISGVRWFLQANKAQRGGAERAIAGKNHRDPGSSGRAKILAFDTSTAICTVALLIDGKIIERSEIAPQRHAALILPMIKDLLESAQIRLQDLNAIAVGQGPGSFMGIRIAIGVAQGLAFGAQLPVITVSSLQILAQTAYAVTSATQIIAGWDARMEAVYWGIYQKNEQGIMSSLKLDSLNTPQEIHIPEGKWLLAGNAWHTYRQPFDPMIKSRPDVALGPPDIFPQANALVLIAEQLYLAGKMQKPHEVKPVYLRDQVVNVKKY